MSKWINVKEQLPERGVKVLAYTAYGFSICEYTVSSRWRGQHGTTVTYWQYLPKEPDMEDITNE